MAAHFLSSPLGDLKILILKPGYFRIESASSEQKTHQGLSIEDLNFNGLSAWAELNKLGTWSIYSLALYYDSHPLDRICLALTPKQKKSVRDTLVDALATWWTTDQEHIAREDIEVELAQERKQLLATLDTLERSLKRYRDGLKQQANLPIPPKDNVSALKSLLHPKKTSIPD